MEHPAYKKTSKECNRKGAIPLTEATLRCFDERGVPFYPSPRIMLSATERNATYRATIARFIGKVNGEGIKKKLLCFSHPTESNSP